MFEQKHKNIFGYKGGGGQKSAKKFGYPKWMVPCKDLMIFLNV